MVIIQGKPRSRSRSGSAVITSATTPTTPNATGNHMTSLPSTLSNINNQPSIGPSRIRGKSNSGGNSPARHHSLTNFVEHSSPRGKYNNKLNNKDEIINHNELNMKVVAWNGPVVDYVRDPICNWSCLWRQPLRRRPIARHCWLSYSLEGHLQLERLQLP